MTDRAIFVLQIRAAGDNGHPMVAGDGGKQGGDRLAHVVRPLDQRAFQRLAEVRAQHAGGSTGQFGLRARPEGGVGAAGLVGLAQQAAARAGGHQRGRHQAAVLGEDQQAGAFGLRQAGKAQQVFLQFLAGLGQSNPQLYAADDDFLHGVLHARGVDETNQRSRCVTPAQAEIKLAIFTSTDRMTVTPA